MASNKEKHQIAFCVSTVTFLVWLSLIAAAIAVGTVPAIVTSIIMGGILTVLSGAQAIESYLFLQDSEKSVTKVKNCVKNIFCSEQESPLFIERIFQPFFDIFNKEPGKCT